MVVVVVVVGGGESGVARTHTHAHTIAVTSMVYFRHVSNRRSMDEESDARHLIIIIHKQ